MSGNAYILDRIERSLDSLSRAEARVARWVLAHPGQTADSAITEVATAAGVSEPTIVRFCRSVGTAGFRDFRTRLIADLHRPVSVLHHDVAADDSTEGAVGKVLESAIRALVDLREPIRSMPFVPTVAALAAARQITFVGIGASGVVAEDACHKFFRLGTPCTAVGDAPTILQRAAIAEPGDVFVATSNTGSWPDMVAAMRDAARRGAVVVALTDPRSPLAAVASQVFECHAADESSVFTPMRSRLVQLALLDALQVTLALHLGADAEARLQASKSALAGRPA